MGFQFSGKNADLEMSISFGDGTDEGAAAWSARLARGHAQISVQNKSIFDDANDDGYDALMQELAASAKIHNRFSRNDLFAFENFVLSQNDQAFQSKIRDATKEKDMYLQILEAGHEITIGFKRKAIEWDPAREPAPGSVEEAIEALKHCSVVAELLVRKLHAQDIGDVETSVEEQIRVQKLKAEGENADNDKVNGVNDWRSFIGDYQAEIYGLAGEFLHSAKDYEASSKLAAIKTQFVEVAALAQTAAEVVRENNSIQRGPF